MWIKKRKVVAQTAVALGIALNFRIKKKTEKMMLPFRMSRDESRYDNW